MNFISKTLITLAGLMLSTAAFACPDLAGQYKCRYKSFTRQIEVTQAKQSGVTIYQVDNGGEIIADGQPHQADTLHPLLDMYASNYNYTATCNGDQVKVEGTADVSGGKGTVDGELLKQGQDLAIAMKLTTTRRTTNITLACVAL